VYEIERFMGFMRFFWDLWDFFFIWPYSAWAILCR